MSLRLPPKAARPGQGWVARVKQETAAYRFVLKSLPPLNTSRV